MVIISLLLQRKRRIHVSDDYYKIPVKNINKVIEENFETYPDIVDIDTEGMDSQIIVY